MMCEHYERVKEVTEASWRVAGTFASGQFILDGAGIIGAWGVGKGQLDERVRGETSCNPSDMAL